ncbi:hypothetical protein AOLI_G00158730 [Acnodon oligacanthus]
MAQGLNWETVYGRWQVIVPPAFTRLPIADISFMTTHRTYQRIDKILQPLLTSTSLTGTLSHSHLLKGQTHHLIHVTLGLKVPDRASFYQSVRCSQSEQHPTNCL